MNKEKKYCELKESIRMTKSQRSDTEESNIIGIDKIIKQNERINNNLSNLLKKTCLF